MTSADAFVSLYRRYRPGKFSELRGQDHVVRALRSAVRDGHVAHAYLFSGPRGTGKTSTARILAKALNCADPQGGEPCGVCPSCIEITRGTSMDVTELDAASNNGVDDMRDLISHAALGSPGRFKVYIVDEVHMLSTAAANALLKTLEEPPGHVIFVLATTDPQKVPPTIRSRTQHLEFRLLGAETLEGLLRDVRDDAGLSLDDEVISLAVRKGHGSARDALSALDQVAASGETEDSRPALIGEVVEGICAEEPGRSLAALASLREIGWGPQQLAVELVEDLRQGFLLRVAPDLAEVTGDDRERLSDQGGRLGLARLVRSIELIGRCQVEMRDAPDPTVVLEVAVVRSARSDLDVGTAGLVDRINRLERRVAELTAGEPAVARTPPPTATPVVEVPSGQTAALGAFRAPSPTEPTRQPTPQPATTSPPPSESAVPDVVPEAVQPAPPPPVAGATVVSREAILSAWKGTVLAQLPVSVRVLFESQLTEVSAEGTLRVIVPTEPYMKKCLTHKEKLDEALGAIFGDAVRLSILVRARKTDMPPAAPAGTEDRSPGPAPEHADEIDDEVVDLDDLVDAPAGSAASVAGALLLEAFPGAVEEEA